MKQETIKLGLLTESGIVDPQEKLGTNIQEYEHNHVLHGDMLTAAIGDELTSTLVKTNWFPEPLLTPFPAAFNDANMELVAMVACSNGDDKSVPQAGVKADKTPL